MTAALNVKELTGGHHGVAAVRELNLHVESGEIVALIGPNGAGKTTTLETVAGLLKPIGGVIEIQGVAVRSTKDAARHGLNYLPERRGLFAELTVRENLMLRAKSRKRGDALFGRYSILSALSERRAGLLSGGEQQVLALACALASDPRVLLIDEMTMGLAPIVVAELMSLVRETATASGTAVLLVEQHVEAALGIADRTYVLQHGRVAIAGTSEELRGRIDDLHESYVPGRLPEA